MNVCSKALLCPRNSHDLASQTSSALSPKYISTLRFSNLYALPQGTRDEQVYVLLLDCCYSEKFRSFLFQHIFPLFSPLFIHSSPSYSPRRLLISPSSFSGPRGFATLFHSCRHRAVIRQRTSSKRISLLRNISHSADRGDCLQ